MKIYACSQGKTRHKLKIENYAALNQLKRPRMAINDNFVGDHLGELAVNISDSTTSLADLGKKLCCL